MDEAATDPSPVLSVMMPVFEEERTLRTILNHVLARPEVGEVVVVDDGSRDRTWEILQRVAATDPRVRPFRQEVNQGKGAALRRAISEVTLPFAIVQDADLEYDPRDYAALLEPLVSGRSDVVFGVRGFAGQTAYSFWFVVGNQLVTLAFNVLFDAFIHDLETGYKALRTDLWRRLELRGTRFDIEPEVAARSTRLGYRIHEVPIRYYARSRAEGKKLGLMDGVHALVALLRLRLAGRGRLFPSQAGDYGYHERRLAELARMHPLALPLDGPGEGTV